MLFNSIDFAIFLPIVFSAYWIIGKYSLRGQNLLIVLASYLFYGWWDWRFLSLILFSTAVDYTVGIFLLKEEKQNKRMLLLWTSIIVNIGFLIFFKYFNFFVDSFVVAFSFFGYKPNMGSLNIILPVGISFYTFQTLSYSIDVYKRKLNATKDFVAFSAFVSFFPQLVAGPIERATNLLPQFYKKRTFDYQNAVNGMRQILWGLFKKVVIADNCAEYVNTIFNNYQDFSGSTLFIGAVLFAFQIYGDFSGYSDIAIGVSRLFGFSLMQNFAFPYFSRDIAEFWRRWHISLSTWFRDYLYIPLGGSQGNLGAKVRNTMIVFLVSGFWHGANWTFIIWGALNALYFLPLLLLQRNRKNTDHIVIGGYFSSLRQFIGIGLTFVLTCFAWIFFRASDLSQAVTMIRKIFSVSFLDLSAQWTNGYITILHLVLILLFIIVEWVNRSCLYGLEKVPKNLFVRYLIYFVLVFTILFTANYHIKQEFIYFQF